MKNINKNIHFKNFMLACLCGLLICGVYSTVHFSANCDGIRNRVLRLHILANSNDALDQEVKLKVRDAILEEGKSIFDGSVQVETAEEKLKAEIPRLEAVANRVLAENGFSYQSKISVGKSFFTTRTYDNKATLPAGTYTAVRVLLGEAKGKNWWCVMFPPMCLPSVQNEVTLEDVLEEEEGKIVESSPKFEVRFKIVEVFEKILEKTK